MRCRNCGAEIPDGQLFCPVCHAEVQIVPDYNPLEDVLAREVKGSVEYATRPINSRDVRRYRSREERENEYATRVLNQGEYRSSTRVLNQGEMSRLRSQYTRTPSASRYGGRSADGSGASYQWDRAGYARRDPGNAASDNGYARRSTAWDNTYARREAGSAAGGSSYVRRDAGNVAGGSGYVRRDAGNVAEGSGYVRRDAGNVAGGSGYARRDAGDWRGSSELRYNTGNVRRETGGMQRNAEAVRGDDEDRNAGTIYPDAPTRQRQRRERKKRSAKKRMQKFFMIFCMILVIGGAAGFFIYQNSYAGMVGKGQKALQSGEYSAAENYFERAIQRNVKKAEAYDGLSKVYIQQKNPDRAEEIFIAAIDSQPENADLYEAAIRFYIETEQEEKISPLLEGCDTSVLSRVSDYVSEAPAFSLDEGTYQEVQEISLTGEGDIYYTDDGSTPTASSTPYTEPILVNVGTTVINAVSINKKGIPSLTATRTYTVELPIADAPAVTPSTGQYNAPFQITVQVPEGYTAYYTTDDSMPSAASEQYTGPIDMPQGSLIFSVVLVSDSGKMTGVTKRNYVLQME